MFHSFVSDSTYKTPRGRLENKVLYWPSGDFPAQISANDYCAVSGMYLMCRPIEEEWQQCLLDLESICLRQSRWYSAAVVGFKGCVATST